MAGLRVAVTGDAKPQNYYISNTEVHEAKEALKKDKEIVFD